MSDGVLALLAGPGALKSQAGAAILIFLGWLRLGGSGCEHQSGF